MEKVIRTLEQFGLTYKQAKTYLAALELGRGTILQIAERAGLNRITTHYIINELIRENLISEIHEDRKRFLYPASPEKLMQILKEKKKNVREILPDLFALSGISYQRPKIRFFNGLSGIKEIYEDTIKSYNPQKEILAYADIKNLEKILGNYLANYIARRSKKGIKVKGIAVNNKTAIKHSQKYRDKLLEIKLFPKTANQIANEVNIYGNKVAIISLQERIGIIIKSKDIAETQRTIFTTLWNGIS